MPPAVKPSIRCSPRRFPATDRSGRKDRKSTRLNSSHLVISYAVFCLKKKKTETNWNTFPFLPIDGVGPPTTRQSHSADEAALANMLHLDSVLCPLCRLHALRLSVAS